MNVISDERRFIRKIGGLSKGDRAFCGKYGVVKCTRAASETKNGCRMFSVSGSSFLDNRGNWTFSAIKRAIVEMSEHLADLR